MPNPLDNVKRVELEDTAIDSDVSLPLSVVRNWVRRGKGMVFYDNVEDQYILQHKGTAVTFNMAEDGTATVAGVRRINNSRVFRTDRYDDVT